MLNKYGYINFGFTRVKEGENIGQRYQSNKQNKTIIIVGGGAAGISAARQLVGFGFKVILLEARKQIGGRVQVTVAKTKDNLQTCPIDIGANVSTGVQGNPIYLLCQQKQILVHNIGERCPLYDCFGGKLDPDIDSNVEKQFNELLDASFQYREKLFAGQLSQNDVSLQNALQLLKQRYVRLPEGGSDEQERRKQSFLSALAWYEAHLEYGCATDLSRVSLRYWDQEDEFEFTGAHSLIPSGYLPLIEHLLDDLKELKDENGDPVFRLLLEHPVSTINHFPDTSASVYCVNGSKFTGDAILLTVPLGVLKQKCIQFLPQLPLWKSQAIDRLGYGVLNKVVLWFDSVFWPTDVDHFGNCSPDITKKGECFLFWNMYNTTHKPILIALMAGDSALTVENEKDEEVVDRSVKILQRMFGESNVKSLLYSTVTHWNSDEFSRGSYSFVAVGSSGDDYDLLSKPVGKSLFFAGEATNRHHPATVAGAMLSGLRETGKICQAFSTVPVALDTQLLNEPVNSNSMHSIMENSQSPGSIQVTSIFNQNDLRRKQYSLYKRSAKNSLVDKHNGNSNHFGSPHSFHSLSRTSKLWQLAVCASPPASDINVTKGDSHSYSRPATTPLPIQPPSSDTVNGISDVTDTSKTLPSNPDETADTTMDLTSDNQPSLDTSQQSSNAPNTNWTDSLFLRDITDQVNTQLKHYIQTNSNKDVSDGELQKIATVLAQKYIQNEFKNTSVVQPQSLRCDQKVELKIRELVRDFYQNGVLDSASISQFSVTKRPPTQPL